jgi:glycosyltransferase involved in cell wall biosynthesis
MLLIISTHPIQYYSPLWVELSRQYTVHVLYLFSNGVFNPVYDEHFNNDIKWDIDLLSNHSHSFLSNQNADLDSKFLKINLIKFIKLLNKIKPKAVLIPGWGYYNFLFIVLICKFKGIQILLRGDSNYRSYPSGISNLLKYIYLKYYFSLIDWFLYVGLANKRLYDLFGINESKLIFSPHAIDGKRFQRRVKSSNDNLINIIFVGKYIPRKNPNIILDLADKAKIYSNKLNWLMVGDGPLSSYINEKIAYLNEIDIKITNLGFINQSKIVEIYSRVDIIILPSIDETWGLVINEAMSCGVVPIVSDQCGCSDDLVADLDNNLVFNYQSIDSLFNSLVYAIEHLSELKLKVDNQIKKFNYGITTKNLSGIINERINI